MSSWDQQLILKASTAEKSRTKILDSALGQAHSTTLIFQFTSISILEITMEGLPWELSDEDSASVRQGQSTEHASSLRWQGRSWQGDPAPHHCQLQALPHKGRCTASNPAHRPRQLPEPGPLGSPAFPAVLSTEHAVIYQQPQMSRG